MLSIKAPSLVSPTIVAPENAQLIEQPPEPKKKRGRVPGTMLRHNKSAVKRLQELGFDPLEELIKLFDRVNEEIDDMLALKEAPKKLTDGTFRRFSQMAYASLIATQQKLSNDLMRYGYARVPETVIVEKEIPRPVINLTKKGEAFEPTEVFLITDEAEE